MRIQRDLEFQMTIEVKDGVRRAAEEGIRKFCLILLDGVPLLHSLSFSLCLTWYIQLDSEIQLGRQGETLKIEVSTGQYESKLKV